MRVAVHPYDLPLAIPYRWAKGEQTRRAGVLVHVRLAQGEGWGETAPPPHEPVDAAALGRTIRAALEGLDPEAPDFLERLDARTPAPRIRCAVATAWWSAQAMAAGRSLAAHLAASAPAAEGPATRVGVNGLVTDAAPDAAAATAARLMASGVRTLKVKCSSDRSENLARLEAIRAAAPTAKLRIDPNEGLDPSWAAAHLAELARFEIEYAEQPIPLHDPESLAALRRASPVPIAADEAATDLAAVRRLIEARAVDALILKPQRLGGPDRLIEIAGEARRAGVASTVTNSLETGVGLTAALHAAACLAPPIPDCGLGTARFFAEDAAAPPAIMEGAMTVPAEPGLGVRPTRFGQAPSVHQ